MGSRRFRPNQSQRARNSPLRVFASDAWRQEPQRPTYSGYVLRFMVTEFFIGAVLLKVSTWSYAMRDEMLWPQLPDALVLGCPVMSLGCPSPRGFRPFHFAGGGIGARPFSRIAAPIPPHRGGISIVGFKKVFLPVDRLQSRIELPAFAAEVIELFL
jgi:hypothetical protein